MQRELEFDHVGFITPHQKGEERLIPPTRVWVTEYHTHPFRVEWLRYEPDSPVTGAVRNRPHVAFRVPDLQAASQGLKVLLEPFDVGFAVVAFFECADGAVIELMQYKHD